MQVREAQDHIRKNIISIYGENESRAISRIALGYILSIEPSIIPSVTKTLSPIERAKLEAIVDRLKTKEPLQYILQESWFYGLNFFVDSNVLIPRPETEELCEWIIRDHQSHPGLKILDIGSGSGCISITLKKNLQDATVSAIDVEPGALNILKRNAIAHDVEIEAIEMDFLEEDNWLKLESFDIIVSNPPYIPKNESSSLSENVTRFEPAVALFVPDDDAQLFYRKIAAFSKTHLNPGGAVYLELHEEHAKETVKLFEQASFRVVLKKDMQGKTRMMKACRETA